MSALADYLKGVTNGELSRQNQGEALSLPSYEVGITVQGNRIKRN
jgi:hypothetical protein